MNPNLLTNLINLLLYQFGWFACVLGMAWDKQSTGIAIALVLMGIHLWLSIDRRVQLQVMLCSGLIGVVVETLLLRLEVLGYASPLEDAKWPPPAMIVLWLQFATLFRYCLSWLSGHSLTALCLGLIGGPLAFYGGEQLGAIRILEPRSLNFVILGSCWAISFPLLITITDFLGAKNKLEAGYHWSTVKTDI